MSTVPEMREACKLVLTNGLTGSQYQVERLPRRPGEFAKGYRLTLLGQWPVGYTCHAHELPNGLHECNCGLWQRSRPCEHTQLLTAAGLFDEPVRPEDLYAPDYFQEDELVDLDWESDAP